jgi:hypothetical protein
MDEVTAEAGELSQEVGPFQPAQLLEYPSQVLPEVVVGGVPEVQSPGRIPRDEQDADGTRRG